ncbi:MAG: hypothetical protein ACNYZG_03910 [Gammaproteobacteria bacterium]
MLYKSIKLKIVKIVFTSLILHSTNLLADNEDVIDYSSVSETLEKLKKHPSSKISKQDGWLIVSLIENGNHVHWFFAPKENAAHPAVVKKTITVKDGSRETVILTLCEAPKQTCDDLIKQFKNINETYK